MPPLQVGQLEGYNLLSYETKIVIEIKQSYPGLMALNPYIESHCMCMVFPLSNDFLIVNGHFRLKHKGNRRESSKSIENKCTH